MAERKLLSEYRDWTQGHPPQFTLKPKNGRMRDKLWLATVRGPKGTPWEEGIFEVEITIGSDFPYKPPDVRITTKMFHHAVSAESGRPCLSVLAYEWDPNTSELSHILEDIETLMEHPQNYDHVQPDVAALYRCDIKRFNRIAAEWSIKFAKGNGGGYIDFDNGPIREDPYFKSDNSQHRRFQGNSHNIVNKFIVRMDEIGIENNNNNSNNNKENANNVNNNNNNNNSNNNEISIDMSSEISSTFDLLLSGMDSSDEKEDDDDNDEYNEYDDNDIVTTMGIDPVDPDEKLIDEDDLDNQINHSSAQPMASSANRNINNNNNNNNNNNHNNNNINNNFNNMNEMNDEIKDDDDIDVMDVDSLTVSNSHTMKSSESKPVLDE